MLIDGKPGTLECRQPDGCQSIADMVCTWIIYTNPNDSRTYYSAVVHYNAPVRMTTPVVFDEIIYVDWSPIIPPEDAGYWGILDGVRIQLYRIKDDTCFSDWRPPDTLLPICTE